MRFGRRGVPALRLVAGAVVLATVLGLAAAWQWSPLAERLDPVAVAGWLEQRAGHPLAPPIVVGAYVPAVAMAIPVTVLVVVTVLAFGLGAGLAYAFLGIVLSASVLYAAGYWLGGHTVRRLAPHRVREISKALARRGVSSIAIVRMVPIAHFTTVNLIAGASHIRFWDYLLGTAIGMTPGLVVTGLVVDRARASLERPGWETALTLIVALAMFALLAILARRWLDRRAAARARRLPPR